MNTYIQIGFQTNAERKFEKWKIIWRTIQTATNSSIKLYAFYIHLILLVWTVPLLILQPLPLPLPLPLLCSAAFIIYLIGYLLCVRTQLCLCFIYAWAFRCIYWQTHAQSERNTTDRPPACIQPKIARFESDFTLKSFVSMVVFIVVLDFIQLQIARLVKCICFHLKPDRSLFGDNKEQISPKNTANTVNNWIKS